ncbi:MAG TPA: tetratricopeptide repeat protein [Desulfobulbus sp.]|nr:tetratricopeptide repeat protein [Desulfobulbus sp.]
MNWLMRPEPSGDIRPDDCILLAQLFEHEVERLFPLPVTVRLYLTPGASTPLVKPDIPEAGIKNILDANTIDSGPHYCAGRLCVPLQLEGGQGAAFFIGNADPALLQKFSSSWLLEFQSMLHQHLQLVRQIYIDPETGLYNTRALEFFLQSAPGEQAGYSLYLVSTFFVRRSTAGSFRKIQYLAGFFSAICPGVLFFLGQGVFAVLVAGNDRTQRLALAHTLQKRLKREGLQRVHVAFAGFQRGEHNIYRDIRQALVVAERRGPYGLCDTDVLRDAEKQPFALPGDDSLKTLKKLWRGVDQFGLALFQCDRAQEKACSIEALLAPLLSDSEQLVAHSHDQVFVFIANASPSITESRMKGVAEKITESGRTSVSVGVCSFPCLQYPKTAMVKNCRKALMHAEFYGPGSVVHFDYLSLNVSGDWYFDEGDFRQAVIEYSHGLKLHPGESNLLNSLGVALIEMNRNRAAIASFTQVLDKDSDNYMALVNLGHAYQMLGRDALALEYFEKAFTVQYHSGISGTDIYQQLSRLYCRAGRYDKALPVLLLWKEAKEGKKDFLLHRLLGEVYAEIGQATDAMKALQQALQLYPHDLLSMSILGLLYVEQGEGEDAGLLLLEKAISIDDGSADCWYRLSRAFLHMGKVKAAHDGVRRCLQLQRGHVPAMLLLGNILLASGKPGRAAAVFHRVLAAKNSLQAERRSAEKALVGLEELHSNKKQVKQ